MKFNATLRSVQGTSASRRLRNAGRVPAIVYGGPEAPINIELDHNEIYHALRKEEFHASILEMDLEGKSQKVLLRAVQWHPFKQLVLHVDFQRVDASHIIHTKVPLHFINGDASPAVKLGGALISQVMNELEISCLPGNLPQFIEVDLGKMIAGETVHLADITLPKGVTFVAHGGDANPALAVAMVKGGAAGEAAAE
ncbi:MULTISPECIES: 50S ribosomal protein L25/general stress protein Ctc [unclassified Pusillimonas]|uniref:50S ribosomal protein L25/general stress protein Ctc n=1 Tax=unclassified Pusillimonas TaxID=2640016 RepID=UPI000B9C7A9E|nr:MULTISPECIES: 50S ribosomal protein L25/general stress protein Ctc [unclassified Pusillimonas]OXR49855.1 50S ribosomal protein L25/general stress protein Ctc [Pusillimonas sp. T2]ROT46809.1 50S ribosomal protein L25/general stress protein Ctc [Pusillimonas sp. NJUB218]